MARTRRMARQGRLRARATVLTDRTRTSRYSDTNVLYPQPVAERKVDREAWAHEIATLIQQEAGGNKSAFARTVGLPNTRSLDRWLRREVNVSEESVRQVARALHLPVVEMLVRVGILDVSDAQGPLLDSVLEDYETIEIIKNADDISPALRREILAHLAKQREEHERQRRAEVERLLEMARHARGRSG